MKGIAEIDTKSPEITAEINGLQSIGMHPLEIRLRMYDIDHVMRATGICFADAASFCQDTTPGWTIEGFKTFYSRISHLVWQTNQRAVKNSGV